MPKRERAVGKKAAGGKKGQKQKKKKPKKDPNAPKRPLSAYFLFQADYREEVKTENPGIKVYEVATKLGQKWKELPEEQKKPYQDRADALKAQYAIDKAAYDKVKAAEPPPSESSSEEEQAPPEESSSSDEESEDLNGGYYNHDEL